MLIAKISGPMLVTKVQALAKVDDFIVNGQRPHPVFATNPEKNFSVPKDLFLHNCFKNADLLLPDGIGIVLAARLLYGVEISRVPGNRYPYRDRMYPPAFKNTLPGSG